MAHSWNFILINNFLKFIKMMKLVEIQNNLIIYFEKQTKIWRKTSFFTLKAILFDGSPMNYFQNYIFIIC